MRFHPVPIRRRTSHKGFTLLESLMAAAILLLIVVAVTSAVTAGQQNALEAHLRIAGALAAEELIGRLMLVPYDELPFWNGYDEKPGEMVDGQSTPLPASFNMVGRKAYVTLTLQTVPGVDVKVLGRTVRVEARDLDNRMIVELHRFVPQPAADSEPLSEPELSGGIGSLDPLGLLPP
jgi:prepilin-type N-terminal cleavage/methylation domain-containing protein